MKVVNYFKSKRQLDKFELKFRMLSFIFFEIKFDISKRCGKLVLFNVGIATENCDC
tara:strand:- start:1395 stop:1562 length:168 start_codon:yes stop_codon:yes gene_type:complete